MIKLQVLSWILKRLSPQVSLQKGVFLQLEKAKGAGRKVWGTDETRKPGKNSTNTGFNILFKIKAIEDEKAEIERIRREAEDAARELAVKRTFMRLVHDKFY